MKPMRQLPAYCRPLFKAQLWLLFVPVLAGMPWFMFLSSLLLFGGRFEWMALPVAAVPLFGLLGLFCGFCFYRALTCESETVGNDTCLGLGLSLMVASLAAGLIWMGVFIGAEHFLGRRLASWLSFLPFLPLLSGWGWAVLYYQGFRTYALPADAVEGVEPLPRFVQQVFAATSGVVLLAGLGWVVLLGQTLLR